MKVNQLYVFALFLLLTLPNAGISQSTENLVGYYSFDKIPDIPDESPSTGGDAKFLNGTASAECGVLGDALFFDGITNYLVSLGTINNQFSTTDFTLSFYFKPYPKSGLMNVVSKYSGDCSSVVPGFSIRYKSNSSELLVEAIQDVDKRVDFKIKLDITNCWHHVVLVREGNRVKLYYNGKLVGNQSTPTRLNMKNNATLTISGGPCVDKTDTRYRGLIDEFRVYNRALKPNRIKELYFNPDKIINQDTIIYLGESVELHGNSPCGITYQWLPETNIVGAKTPNAIVMPTETTTYTYQAHTGQCVGASVDEVTITVVDPSKVDCKKLLFPTAFTPNHDGLNEDFTFDTPLVVIDQFKLLEIFDRWGNRVFYTENPLEAWNGNFGDQEVNPGVFLYRAQFVCKGEEENQVGQVTLIR